MIIVEPIKDDGVGSNEGPKEAFCPLLHRAGEGAVMVITDDEGNYLEKRFVRGLCTKVIDCDSCQYMQNEVAQHPAEDVCWVCPTCIDIVFKWAKGHGVPIDVPGFYSEGYCQFPWCERPVSETIRVPARYSRFRQIVFGKLRT